MLSSTGQRMMTSLEGSRPTGLMAQDADMQHGADGPELRYAGRVGISERTQPNGNIYGPRSVINAREDSGVTYRRSPQFILPSSNSLDS